MPVASALRRRRAWAARAVPAKVRCGTWRASGPSRPATAGPAPPVRRHFGGMAFRHAARQLADRPHHAPKQPGAHGRRGGQAHGRRRFRQFGHGEQRQEIGELVRARADMAKPGKMAPPQKAPSADTKSTVTAVPTSTTTAARSAAHSWLAATASNRRSTPTMSGRSRRISSGKSLAVSSVTASSAPTPATNPTVASWPTDSRCRCTRTTPLPLPQGARGERRQPGGQLL